MCTNLKPLIVRTECSGEPELRLWLIDKIMTVTILSEQPVINLKNKKQQEIIIPGNSSDNSSELLSCIIKIVLINKFENSVVSIHSNYFFKKCQP
jgi:hypothetical protein